MRRVLGAALLVASLSAPAAAGTVRGSVRPPPERPATSRDGHWRVENGVLPIGPPVPDPRGEALVVLEGGPAPAKKDEPPSVTVELHGVRLDPRLVAVPVGASVTFKNGDRMPHALHLPTAQTIMPPEPQPAGKSRTVRLLGPGHYPIRDEEFPHVEGDLLVLASPLFAVTDDRGSFKIEAPEGKYTLRVFFRGRWALTQELEVGSRSTEVVLQIPDNAPAAPAEPTSP